MSTILEKLSEAVGNAKNKTIIDAYHYAASKFGDLMRHPYGVRYHPNDANNTVTFNRDDIQLTEDGVAIRFAGKNQGYWYQLGERIGRGALTYGEPLTDEVVSDTWKRIFEGYPVDLAITHDRPGASHTVVLAFPKTTSLEGHAENLLILEEVAKKIQLAAGLDERTQKLRAEGSKNVPRDAAAAARAEFQALRAELQSPAATCS